MRTNAPKRKAKIVAISVLASLSTAVVALVMPVSILAAEPSVRQGTTTTYGVLAGTTITNTGATTMLGTAGSNIGLSPGTAFTNTGSVTIGGSTQLTNSAASIAQSDLVTAYNDLGIPSAITLSNVDLGGQTLTPGTYASGSSLANSTNLTFDAQGNDAAVFI